MTTSSTDRLQHDGASTEWLEVVRKNVAGLRYGSVHITVHDGRVTQVESIEKTRFITPREEVTGRR
ncbi:MAG: YezD family protein [Luteolibacter sp.]